ncbi:MAG: T9SS type A sorting domain-containing protein [Balneolaceae bacterium]
MKLLRYSILCLFLSGIFSISSQAQFFEDFEDGEKTFYGGASVTLATGAWFLDDALLGSLANDKYNGNQGVRMDRRDGKTGNIYMQFDKANGADEISFFFANYGSSSGNTLQVQYSTNGGSSWTNIGDVLEATGTLSQVTIPVAVDGNIRFKFVQQAGTDRLNIDDIRITDFVVAQDGATISVTADDEAVSNDGAISFPKTLVGNPSNKIIEVKNVGDTTLNISQVSISGFGFSITDLADSTLEFNESTELTLTFDPIAAGAAQGSLSFTSDDLDTPTFSVDLQGEGFEDGDIITIAEARELPLGTRVSITGVVTVAEEFRGPMYFQDASAGIAWFNSDMRGEGDAFLLDVSRGDSIVISGELGEFSDLVQIVGTDVDYEFFESTTEIEPASITLSEMNSGDYEGQLVSIEVSIDNPGILQGNTNYTINDESGSGQMRISAFSDIAGSDAPEGTTVIVGVVGIFSGTYQLLPRDLDDIDAEQTVIPGEDIPMDETFDIVTWNIEWFGSGGGGPDDLALQLENVKTVITTIDADIYALQEISSESQFEQLLSDLDEYGGFRASFSQTQRTAYLFKRATVDSLDSGLITSGMSTENWANGRFPLLFHFSTEIGEGTQEIYMYNIHSKAFGDAASYSQRLNASNEMKAYLDGFRASDNVVLIGDYNDEMETSITGSDDSPYRNFVEDEDYFVVTKALEDKGFNSQSSGSFLDHITFTTELMDEYFTGTERVENTSYVSSYLSTTSDHFPVWTRFFIGEPISNEEDDNNIPQTISLEQNFPNPFNPSTVINYTLSANSFVSLEVYDLMGRKVSTLVNGRQAAGAQQVTFDASQLSSGVYIYRLNAAGKQLSKKMVLVK